MKQTRGRIQTNFLDTYIGLVLHSFRKTKPICTFQKLEMYGSKQEGEYKLISWTPILVWSCTLFVRPNQYVLFKSQKCMKQTKAYDFFLLPMLLQKQKYFLSILPILYFRKYFYFIFKKTKKMISYCLYWTVSNANRQPCKYIYIYIYIYVYILDTTRTSHQTPTLPKIF